MITVSVCMIVKNEEKNLERCLNSLKGFYDELIIVDTGSTDKTKEIAGRYTDKIYDFQWVGDFSLARNVAFSYATCDYIYSADADEVVDEVNRRMLIDLKTIMDPGVEVVQMRYVNPADVNMCYNDLEELRPKLFKRLRSWTWIDPIHETVRTEPVVFDSDIAILHRPHENHAKRDFEAFLRILERDGRMSARLFSMYAKELFFSGEGEDFLRAEKWFEKRNSEAGTYEFYEDLAIALKCAILRGDSDKAEMLRERYEEAGIEVGDILFLLAENARNKGEEEEANEYMRRNSNCENIICTKLR